MIEVRNLKKLFPVRGGTVLSLSSRERRNVHAVDGVSFHVIEGEVLGLVGESGCGKTTTGRLLCRYEEPASGSILFEGNDVSSLRGEHLKRFRKRAQMIFQDPYESLDPRFIIGRSIMEPLMLQGIGASEAERYEMMSKMLEVVGLRPSEDFINRFPHELSGGQRQRVVIARAMIIQPKFIVADEPVSMLDVSIRSGILNLMLDMKRDFGVTYAFITHDLAVSRYMSDRIAIMYLGKIVEIGHKDEVIHQSLHPYTQLLMSAVPSPDPTIKRIRTTVAGEVPSATDIPSGCRYHPRCPQAKDACKSMEPELVEFRRDHYAACDRSR